METKYTPEYLRQNKVAVLIINREEEIEIVKIFPTPGLNHEYSTVGINNMKFPYYRAAGCSWDDSHDFFTKEGYELISFSNIYLPELSKIFPDPINESFQIF